MDFSVETAVANQLAHQDRVKKILAETGGEIIHPDHYKFRMQFRDDILAAMDVSCDEQQFPRVEDRDLPELFKTLDSLAEKLFLRRVGL
jgi:hypothetical protein